MRRELPAFPATPHARTPQGCLLVLSPIRGVAWLLLALVVGSVLGTGCGRQAAAHVVVYAAQDRVYAEPLFREFERATGLEVRAVYDNEATKTTGLANRLLGEKPNPQADLWWSNEEMRTRHLVRLGALETGWTRFGARARVLVCTSNRLATLTSIPTLQTLTNSEWKGRVAIAYPLFGTTVTHFLMLRQRWGEARWKTWCEALRANRPLMVDGNSVVVRLVTSGEAWLGLTDTDDVEAARREGAALATIPLSGQEALPMPNTLAVVRGARHPESARRLAEYLASAPVVERLRSQGALEIPSLGTGASPGDTDVVWDSLLAELDPSVRWLEEAYRR